MHLSDLPLVSIICLCYNQERFIEEAIESVFMQDYPNIECFVVDDCSVDGSRDKILKLALQYPSLKIMLNDSNIGMCASFNNALKLAKGEYLIDLAADDVLHWKRVSTQVQCFRGLPGKYGVVFTDAWIMNEAGYVTNAFYDNCVRVPSGDIFAQLLKNYFVCAPSIMIRRSVMNVLGGYDESLAFEDYDFFIRSSRQYYYFYLNERLVFHRSVKNSSSSSWYKPYENPLLQSTYRIHVLAGSLIQDVTECNALNFSIAYHWRQAVYLQVGTIELHYRNLLIRLRPLRKTERILLLISKIIPLAPLYLCFVRVRKFLFKFSHRVACKRIHWRMCESEPYPHHQR